MAITVVSTTPASGSTEQYIDYSIFVQFSAEIESSYLDSTYFKIYRTNESHTSFYELVAVTVSKDGAVVEIDPMSNLRPSEYYTLIIVGGTAGIQSITGDTLGSNSVIYWKTAATISPVTSTPGVIPDVVLYQDGDRTDDEYEPSSDAFSATGSGAAISLVSTFPTNKSVGVTTLDNLIFLYNDDIASDLTVPVNILKGRYNDLPVDMDPFGDRSITITGVVSYDNQVVFSMSGIVDSENKEYTFTMAPGVIRGETREGVDSRTHEIKLMGPLDPVYATPDQISTRVTGWDAEVDTSFTDYDLWKLILEASTWVRDVYGATMTEDNMIQVNKLTICLVLLEMFIRGFILSGGVRARTLLAIRVDYEQTDWNTVVDELEKCIRDSMPDDVASAGGVAIGIKSGAGLNSIAGFNTKRYGIYR